MKPFHTGIAMGVAGAVCLVLAVDVQAGKLTARTAKLEQKVEQQQDEIELLKMRIELLEGVVKPGQQGATASSGEGLISPADITYP